MIHRFSISNDVDKLAAGQQQPSYRSDIEQKNTPIQLHDPASVDMAFANKIAQEIINISGANVFVYPRTENAYDPTWEEDADPTYGKRIAVKGFFAPQPMKTELALWGLDTSNQTTVIFCREEIYKLFGTRMIREDDIIELPYNSGIKNKNLDRFRVLTAADSGNFRYNWLYLSCTVENITNDENLDVMLK